MERMAPVETGMHVHFYLSAMVLTLRIGLAGPFNETVGYFLPEAHLMFSNTQQYFGFYEDAVNYITQTKGAYALIDVRLLCEDILPSVDIMVYSRTIM